MYASSNELDTKTIEESKKEPNGVTKIEEEEESEGARKILTAAIDKDLKKVGFLFFVLIDFCNAQFVLFFNLLMLVHVLPEF